MSVELDNSNVSKVLGQIVDYPDQYDPSILVREPRQSNRKHLDISDDSPPFIGADVWNAYEISCLTKSGLPVAAIAKIVYPCTNKYIVESKSIKLYFNSYNMSRFGDTREEALREIGDRASADLSDLLDTNVVVCLFTPTESRELARSHIFDPNVYTTLEDDDNLVNDMVFDTYSETPIYLNLHKTVIKLNSFIIVVY